MLVGVFITFVTALAYIEYIVETCACRVPSLRYNSLTCCREFWVSTTSAPSPILATAWVQLSPESRNLYKQSVFALYPNCLW